MVFFVGKFLEDFTGISKESKQIEEFFWQDDRVKGQITSGFVPVLRVSKVWFNFEVNRPSAGHNKDPKKLKSSITVGT